MACSSNADAMGSTGKQSDYVDRFHRIGIQIHSKIKEQHQHEAQDKTMEIIQEWNLVDYNVLFQLLTFRCIQRVMVRLVPTEEFSG